jgi:hypothetical protein
LINLESNYRQFYCNDHDFFLKVISKETKGPYNFKLNVQVKNKNREEGARESGKMIESDQKAKVFEFLDSLHAENIKEIPVKESHGTQIRIIFTIQD